MVVHLGVLFSKLDLNPDSARAIRWGLCMSPSFIRALNTMTSSLAETGTAGGLTGIPTRLAGPTGLALVQGLSARVIYIAMTNILSLCSNPKNIR